MRLLVLSPVTPSCCLFFFFNDTATTEIYTLSLHDALPISSCTSFVGVPSTRRSRRTKSSSCRSEERFSRNAETDIVCRLLLEKKKNQETDARPRHVTRLPPTPIAQPGESA